MRVIKRKLLPRAVCAGLVLLVAGLLPAPWARAGALLTEHHRLAAWSAVNHRYTVPAGSTLLVARIEAGEGDLDMFLKKGSPVSGASLSAIREDADVYSVRDDWREVLALNPDGSPALSVGDWYLAVVNLSDNPATYTAGVFLEGPAPAATRLYFPYVIEYQNWHSTVSLLNGDDRETISGTLTPYDNAGNALDGARQVTLVPNGRVDFAVATSFPDPGDIYYLVFSSNAAMVKGFARVYVDGLYRVALPAVSMAAAGDLNLSHIASDAEWSTEITLLNTASENREVNLVFNTGQEMARRLAPGAVDSFTISRLFGGQPQPQILSARISGAAGVIGVELFANNNLRILEGLLLDDAVAEKLFFPHTAISDGWATGVALFNPVAATCELTLTPFDAAGNDLTPFYSSISGYEKYIGNVASLGFPAAAAWVRVEASHPLAGFELFMKYNQMGGYSAVNLNGREGYFAQVGNGDVTGIAFINQDSFPAAVQLTAFDGAGAVVAGRDLTLAVYEKQVNVAEAFFDDDIAAATHIRFSSDRQVVGFALNFSPDGTMLDGMGATLLPEAAEVAGAGVVELAARALEARDQAAFTSLLSSASRSLVEALGSEFSLTSAAGATAADELAAALRQGSALHANREMVAYETSLGGEVFTFQVIFDGDSGRWLLGGL